jgi:hypothetical protein
MKLSKQIARVLVLLAVSLLTAASAWAQYTTGQVSGTVRDASGAVVANAAVTLRNVDTNLARTATTSAEGNYAFPAVTAGRYVLEVSASGFAAPTAKIEVATNQTVTQDFALRVGRQSESVEVTATAGALDIVKSEAQLSTTRFEEELQNLPNIGRTPTSLAAFTPGVQPTQSPRGGSLAITSGSQAGSLAANGGRARATAAQLDYTDINDWEFGGIALRTTPNDDMVQEFKVLTSNFNAEHGVKSNAQIIMVTRSGTNKLHGTAYDFVQNDIFNARAYFDTSGKPAIIRRNNYGFTLGGPVIRNKTFAFGGYEKTAQRGAGSTVVATVPTAAARARATDPTSIDLIKRFLPLPTASTANPDIGTITSTLSSPNDGYQYILKIDQQFTDKHSLSGRYLHASGASVLRFAALNTLPGFDTDFKSFARNLSISDTYVATPKIVNQLRLAYGRSAGLILNEGGLDSPRFQITGLVNFGALNLFPNTRLFNVYQLNDIVSYTNGNHNFKFGGDFRKIQDNSLLPANIKGLYTFANLNSFLAGQPSSWTQLFGTQYRGFRTGLHSLFAQDDWRVTPTLTLNLGLRWEYQGAMSEAHGLTSVLDVNIPGAIGAAGSGPLGSFHVGNPSIESNPANFAPRFGFAWNPGAGKLVIRGGYGIFYDSFSFTPQTFSRGVPPLNYNFTLAGSQISGANNFGNLVSGTAPIVAQGNAQVGSFGNLTNLGEIQTINRFMRNPYSQHFSVGVEYQVAKNSSLRIGYVGTKGTHLTVFTPINPIKNPPAPATSVADEAARIAQFRAAVAASNGPGNNRLDPRFDTVSFHTDTASSTFHSLQTEFNTRFTGPGLFFRAAYTWSRSIDNASDFTTEQQANDNNYAQQCYNLTAERGVSNYDIPHRLVFSASWQIPYLKEQKGLLGHVLGGWSMHTIGTWQSGVPGTLLAGARSGIQDVNIDGNIIPRVALDNTRANCADNFHFQFNNPAAISGISQPLLGNYGTCGRNNVRLPSLNNVDLSLFKDIRLFESGPLGSGPWNLQFRAEGYNAFNSPYLTANGNAWRTVNSPSFGKANAAGPTRRVQLALKLTW